MKKYIIIFVLNCFVISITKAQNPAFYQQHPTNSSILWYNQINIDPVIIKSGNVVSENAKPDWYGGFQFISCPGVFNTVDEAYGYLTTNPEFLDTNEYSYYNRNKPDEQLLHIEKSTLQESISFTNEQAKNDANAYIISDCREKVIFNELYLKIDQMEVVLLYSASMFLVDLDSNSSADRTIITNYILSGYTPAVQGNYALELTVLIKENGVWKYPYSEAFIPFLDQKLGIQEFAKINGIPIVNVVSTVDSLRNRVYQKQ